MHRRLEEWMGGYPRPLTTMRCGLGYESRTTDVCFMFYFGFVFLFDDYGLSTKLNHGGNLIVPRFPS
jgi:hypothetical protein